jgi:urease accessory protein
LHNQQAQLSRNLRIAPGGGSGLPLVLAMSEHAAQLLRLLHLADSALPVGATAHSFGLETLVQDGDVDLLLLERWFSDYLLEAGTLDAFYCRRAYQLERSSDSAASTSFVQSWRLCNRQLGALRPARESRAASHALGGRLLRLLADLEPHPLWQTALEVRDSDSHYCCVFGLGGAHLGLNEDETALALLRQNVAGLVSACQRLMPLGQGRAGRLLWQLQDAIISAAQMSLDADQPPCFFTALLDVGSMRHPQRNVRLFIS